ncbi:MAG: hypothetical protein M1834_009495 [Cirrosporium novae-zelandiae]|nr:MAG: hypothetical protein M1834_009495 [Cirrosporium novae-zelandiae]
MSRFGTYTTSNAILAGLDLEMPGPTRWRTSTLEHSITCNKVSMHVLDKRVHNVLSFVNRASKAGIPKNAIEGTRNAPEDQVLMRSVAADTIVLMKNEDKILPFSKNKTIAVIGPNAKTAVFCGGGSASLLPYYAVSPFEGITAKCSDVKFEQGAYANKELPLLGRSLKTADGKPGVTFRAYLEPSSNLDRKCVDELSLKDTYLFLVDYITIESHLFYASIEGLLTPEEDGTWDFGLSVQGTAKLFVDDKLVVDNATTQKAGDSFFGAGTGEVVGSIDLKKGQSYKLLVDFGSAPTSTVKVHGTTNFGKGGFRLGGRARMDPKEAIAKAAKLASEVDQVVVIAGLNGDWESEGHDRCNMDLPVYNDDLIAGVLATNPNAAVVMQSGTPVTMPWASKVKALVHAWYGGNEGGNAIADVLFGDVNPNGKLSLSWPKRVQDNPAYLHFRSENGRVLYGEDVYVGYRYYEKTETEVLFPFGHGLSYTAFSLSNPVVKTEGETLDVTVDVTNTGSCDGKEVVQVYVSQVSPSVGRAVKELKGFAKVKVPKGGNTTAKVQIPIKYATSFWDEVRNQWKSEEGAYEVHIGNSSANMPLKGQFKVEKTTWWSGL